ncbi:protoporphyrinogen oxidase [Paenibacillus thermotolerans]|uniref:protoporphyrinogen oxidase n=1 Tax=Paenibacillus thermotolerans TaxID=3027807 RepID=UPI002368B535|nr:MULTISPECIES: protoporphyrinogen oxidase [unclassified Paenibacillus]
MTEEQAKRRSVVVIGGGITGLSAAYYAAKGLKEAGCEAEVTLLESSARLGGKVKTLRRDGFVIERGPDSFLARKPATLELTRDLGIEGELVRQGPRAKKTYILHNGKLHRIPPGFVLGVPTQWQPFVATGLISLPGKLRAALDLVLPGAKKTEDETLGGFLTRRLGREVVERVAEPLLSGIYGGDADNLSLLATFPQFRAIENKYGSLIAGMSRGAGATRSGPSAEGLIPEHLKGSAFLSYRKGLTTLIEALTAALDELHVNVRTETAVHEIRHADGRNEVVLADGSPIAADAVVVTTPAPVTAKMLPELSEAQPFKEMQYASVANIVLVYKRDGLENDLDGSGFLVPNVEGRFITACTWTSSKWPHTAPEEYAIIRCYVGRAHDRRWLELSEEEVIAGVKRDIAELTGIRAEPEFVDMNRLTGSMPQYRVGHVERVRALREALRAKMPGVYAAGASYDGLGLPDCIHQAKEAVKSALERITGASTGRA